MLYTRATAFQVVKGGNAEAEWEDAAACDQGDPASGHAPRFGIADGATEAYDSIRWADRLVALFVDPGGRPPDLSRASLRSWLTDAQADWVAGAPPAFASLFEERKYAEGSFATFLGCEVLGADGPRPTWTAVAIGDAVLFHVRDARLVAHFPPVEAGDFGLNPDGVHTDPSTLEAMLARLERTGPHPLRPGDRLFLATDALAHWIVRAGARMAQADLWRLLDGLSHPGAFDDFVRGERSAGFLKNDDVTLVRIAFSASDAEYLLECL